EACDAVEAVLSGIDLAAYESNRAIRSAVERELILIGEAVSVLGRVAPEAVGPISHARMIVGLRNVLTHGYAAVDDETVFETACADLPGLRRECAVLLERMEEAD
ncbi:MAG: HepT-like ribonuclease domain-containing protein, partial [Actinomycetota bacterium]